MSSGDPFRYYTPSKTFLCGYNTAADIFAREREQDDQRKHRGGIHTPITTLSLFSLHRYDDGDTAAGPSLYYVLPRTLHLQYLLQLEDMIATQRYGVNG